METPAEEAAMKIPILTLTGTLLLAALPPQRVAAQSGHDLLAQALVMERAEGNLDGAVILYNRILEEHGRNRTLCATALFQMASFYERLGRPEAVDVFRRVIEEYPDQAEQARRAQLRMEALRGLAAPERRASVAPDPTYTLLAEDEGFVQFGQGRGAVSLSPDGNRLILWIRDLGVYLFDPLTDLPRHILALRNPADGLTDAKWSPDGTRIAVVYVQHPLGNLPWSESVLIIDPEGNETARIPLSREGIEASSLPSGVYSPAALSVVWEPDQQGFTYARHGGIYSVGFEGGETKLAGEASVGFRPVLGGYSPDGDWLAYSTTLWDGSGSGFEVWVMPAAGGPAHNLTRHPAMDLTPRWGADGSIYFVSDRNGSRDIWRMEFDSQTGERVGEPEQLTFFEEAQVTAPSPSQDDSRMAFILWRAETVVRVAEARNPGASRPVGRGGIRDLSPDGRRVLFGYDKAGYSTAAPREDAIYSVSSSGGAPVLLSPDAHSSIWYARFSEDGSMVNYIANSADGWAEFQVPSTGGEPTEIRRIVGASDENPVVGRWSPDGSFRVFVRGNGLYRVPREGGEPMLLAELAQWDQPSLEFSPDGRSVSLMGLSDPRRSWAEPFQSEDIYVVPVEGGEPRRLTTSEERTMKSAPSWHPDGMRLTYLARDENDHSSTRMAYLDGRPTTLFHDEPGVEDRESEWAPDGTAFFFQGYDGEGNESTYRRNSDGTVDLLWTDGSLPRLSADGRTYLFLSWEISSQLWLMEDFR
jgi:Tol biopolymer transport system component